MARATAILTRTLKWSSITLIVLLLAVVLLAIFIDWNRVKPHIERFISEQTGREFAIDGDLDVDLWSWQSSLRAERVRFENARWGKHPQMAQVGAFQTSIDLLQLVQGRVVVPELIVARPVVHVAKSRRGTPNWELNPGAEPKQPAKAPEETPAPAQPAELPVIRRLLVTDGLVTYRDSANKADTTLTLAKVSGSTDGADGQVMLDGRGRLEEQPWRVALRAGALDKLQSTRAPYPVDLGLAVGTTRANIKGKIAKPTRLGGVDLGISLQGPGLAMLAPFFGKAAPKLPAYDIKGRITHTGEVWRLQDLLATVGKSDLKGEAAFNAGGERPLVKADLSTSHFDYADFAGLAPPSKPEKKQQPAPPDLGALRALDAIVNLRGDEIVTPAVALKDIRASVRLRDGRLRVEPLAIGVGDGRVSAQAALDARSRPFEAKVRTEIQQVDLGELREFAKANEALEGIVDGRIEISVTGASRAQMKQNAGAGALAVIDSLMIDDSRLAYDTPDGDTTLRIIADTITRDGRRQLGIHGSGRYRGEPFNLDLRTDPLLALADTRTDKPYAIDLQASGANTEIAATGTLRQPAGSDALRGANPVH